MPRMGFIITPPTPIWQYLPSGKFLTSRNPSQLFRYHNIDTGDDIPRTEDQANAPDYPLGH